MLYVRTSGSIPYFLSSRAKMSRVLAWAGVPAICGSLESSRDSESAFAGEASVAAFASSSRLCCAFAEVKPTIDVCVVCVACADANDAVADALASDTAIAAVSLEIVIPVRPVLRVRVGWRREAPLRDHSRRIERR